MNVITAFLATVAAAVGGSVIHEFLHWITAHAVGAENVGFKWGGWFSKTYVTYEIVASARFRRLCINLSPQALTIGLFAWVVSTAGLPKPTFDWLIAIAFLLGLGIFGGREDFITAVS